MSAAPSALQSASQASQKPEDLDDMPDHWKVPKSNGTMLSRIQILAFHALCLVSITRPSLSVHCWVSKRSDEEWERHRKMVCDKLNASNVAAGLVLTTSAVYLTTQPPTMELSLLPYTTLASYIFSILSFVQAMGSMLSGVAIIAVYESCDREWTLDVLTSTRFRLCCTLIILACPSLSLVISILCLMAALMIAGLSSGVWFIQLIAYLEVACWIWVPIVFLWCAIPMDFWKELGGRRPAHQKLLEAGGVVTSS
ncbi:hypothetical protein M405DRAFT_867948 [Rhizopogon salebrosus TDB-379]|nr:hypothetical protein M405DRAFT_867948 [Rhizopogon salebrosus TDB-379]